MHAYINQEETQKTGNLTWNPAPQILGVQLERPDIDPAYSVPYILSGVLIGTLIVLILIRYRKVSVWKTWFYIAVVICLTYAFGAFTFIPGLIALIISLLLGYFKVFKPNVYVHNFTELFLYAGMASIFVPVINLLSIIILLLLISAYDFYAVYKSKHMITMAKFQSEAKVFAGLFIPYEKIHIEDVTRMGVNKKVRHAILGGGDIAFPLLFAGVILKDYGFLLSLIVPIFTTLALSWLLFNGEKEKFYPAMPIISVGCFLGWGVVWLINII